MKGNLSLTQAIPAFLLEEDELQVLIHKVNPLPDGRNQV